MKKILMIGTGGTIASLKTENGLTPGLTTRDILSYIPAVEHICEVETTQVCNLDSTNVTSDHWKLIVKTIEDNYNKFDGFVVCHGTDTLAYTAAALSYMIQDSAKPIVVTGAQKPINLDVTDGKTNLLDSFIYASDDDAWNVNIVFGGKVIAGTRAKKERAKSYNAFASINYPYRAIIQDGRLIRYIFQPKPAEDAVKFSYNMVESVCVLKLTPGIKPDIMKFLFEHHRCLIIESFGVGGVPSYLVDTLREAIENGKEQGKFAVVTTQVANEGSDMTVYEVGKRIKQELGLIEAYDMTLEATITKLMWIMGQEVSSYEEMKKLFYKRINFDTLVQKSIS